MKKKEKQQIRTMKTAELGKKVFELHAAIERMKLDRVSAPVKNVREIYNMRKNLAVVESIAKEKMKENA